MSDQFDDEQLRAAYEPILRGSRSNHDANCPSPDALLAAVRGEGAERERLEVLDHALRCDACRPELALLHSVSGQSAGLKLVTDRGRSWQRFVPWAAAASIILAVGLVTVDRLGKRGDGEITRGAKSEVALISPASDGATAAGPVTFIWHPIERAIQYTLEVDANDGSVLFTARGADTVRTVTSLSAGELRWSVRAQMNDGSERRSVFRILRVR